MRGIPLRHHGSVGKRIGLTIIALAFCPEDNGNWVQRTSLATARDKPWSKTAGVPTPPTTSGANLDRQGQRVGETPLAAAYPTELGQGLADCYRSKVWDKDPPAKSTPLGVAQKTAKAFRRRQSGRQANTLAIGWAFLGQQTWMKGTPRKTIA